MLTRLQVNGFKNLVDVDVRFGPLTCLAGPNGAGKSNLFDAILFLSELADKPFTEAARSIRGGESPGGLFSAQGDGRIQLTAEMIIPNEGEDEFGQRTKASASFVRYELELALRSEHDHPGNGAIRLQREALTPVSEPRTQDRLGFPYTREWRESAIPRSRRRAAFISTDAEQAIVKLPLDGMPGRPTTLPIATLPRTVLSSSQNADRNPTAVLVRQEMRSWRVLQLEPSSMRSPDDLWTEGPMTVTGAHIPATLYRIASQAGDQEQVYATTSNRLAELVPGVRRIWIDRDEGRRILTLKMEDRYGLALPANVLSDGTLRFIALTVLQQDPLETGLICLEEPENGIHPERVGAMLELLGDIAIDTENVVSPGNPLRQIIINTHSPVVAKLVGEGELLFASLRSGRLGSRRISKFSLACLGSTWRAEGGAETIPRGRILAYLAGVSEDEEEGGRRRGNRVMDRFHSYPRSAASATS